MCVNKQNICKHANFKKNIGRHRKWNSHNLQCQIFSGPFSEVVPNALLTKKLKLTIVYHDIQSRV